MATTQDQINQAWMDYWNGKGARPTSGQFTGYGNTVNPVLIDAYGNVSANPAWNAANQMYPTTTGGQAAPAQPAPSGQLSLTPKNGKVPVLPNGQSAAQAWLQANAPANPPPTFSSIYKGFQTPQNAPYTPPLDWTRPGGNPNLAAEYAAQPLSKAMSSYQLTGKAWQGIGGGKSVTPQQQAVVSAGVFGNAAPTPVSLPRTNALNSVGDILAAMGLSGIGLNPTPNLGGPTVLTSPPANTKAPGVASNPNPPENLPDLSAFGWDWQRPGDIPQLDTLLHSDQFRLWYNYVDPNSGQSNADYWDSLTNEQKGQVLSAINSTVPAIRQHGFPNNQDLLATMATNNAIDYFKALTDLGQYPSSPFSSYYPAWSNWGYGGGGGGYYNSVPKWLTNLTNWQIT